MNAEQARRLHDRLDEHIKECSVVNTRLSVQLAELSVKVDLVGRLCWCLVAGVIGIVLERLMGLI
ncbi:hypothetical protein [Candidatus Palauibacter sp.]|uniref:hypothetical protein n=1 Tax=Candidatus Palauibacter sp. TaxID=3101350 RepID=UPI003CC5EDF7